MSATRRVARFLALSRLERRVLGEALVLLALASAAIRWSGLRRTEDMLERLVSRGTARPGLDAHTIARLVSAAARHGALRAKCLPASLALKSLLRRYGMRGQLRLGVRRQDGRIEAHAWIEHDGTALLEPSVGTRFHAFEADARL